jgi:hypothetical protein
MNHQADRILELARSKGVLRTRDVDSAGASRALLASLTDEGKLLKLGRGLYVLPDRAASAYDTFAEVAARSENGVLCLLSALRFHDLTTQQSSDVWLAIPHKAHAPRFDYPPLRVIRMSGPAMTVADCFKFRNKIGLDVALEALREAWNGKRATMDELWRYAEICRVANVMRPYLETVGVA